MKKKLFVLWLFCLAMPMEQYAQKHDVTHFINWLVAYKELASTGMIKKIPLPKNIDSFMRYHGIPLEDSNAVKQQLQNPTGKIRRLKIKRAKLLSPEQMEEWIASFYKVNGEAPPYFSISPPIFLTNKRIWVKLETVCGDLCGGVLSLVFERSGNTYKRADGGKLLRIR